MEATYKSGRALANATVAALIVLTLTMLVRLVLIELTVRQAGTFDADAAGARLALLSGIRAGMWLVQAGAIVFFSLWVHRATANLPALGAGATRFTPAQAVAAFFIPLVNLVRGYQVMAMIWLESQPRARVDGGDLKPRSVVIVNAWYALWLGSSVVAVIASPLNHDWMSTLMRVAFAGNTAAALLCAIMVHRADARQGAQHDDLRRRADQPQPTGSELR